MTPKNAPLVGIQRMYLGKIRDFLRENKVPPTLTELTPKGLSKNSPRQAVDRLILKGYLRRAGRLRSLVITPKGYAALKKRA